VPFLVNKYYAELRFQRKWVGQFVGNEAKVLQYWKEYRYLDDIQRICQIDDSKTVLDIGCGISSVLHFVRGRRFGIDPLAEEYAKIYDYPPELTIRRGFGEKVPFPDKFFDVVFCSNVLDHTTDPERTLEEISRVLKRDGHFVMTVEIFEDKAERDLSHPHSLTREDVEALLGRRFVVEFERTSPWMWLMSYVDGSKEVIGEQLVMVMRNAAAAQAAAGPVAQPVFVARGQVE
jgi:ubiquinone/menaquinone biosynthesis C-methylase UbiE